MWSTPRKTRTRPQAQHRLSRWPHTIAAQSAGFRLLTPPSHLDMLPRAPQLKGKLDMFMALEQQRKQLLAAMGR